MKKTDSEAIVETVPFSRGARPIEQKFIGDPAIHGCEKGVNTVVGVG